MRGFLSSTRAKILLGLLAVLAGFMIASVYRGGTASMFGQIASIITVPVQRLSSRISFSASEFFGQFINAKRIKEENLVLTSEVNELRRALADYEKLKHENGQFREIIGVMENRQDLSLEPASVIAREAVGRFYSCTIDKGTLDGVSRLDPVMTADGLVGYIYEVGMTYAKIMTILDVVMDVGVYDAGTRDIGIVSGTVALAQEGLCQMEYLPRESKIAEGDIILTSGGSIFPRDILIGTVSEVTPNSHGTSLAAVIKPAADIASLKDVFVITYFEGQGVN